MKLFLEWQAKIATQISYLYRLQIYKKTEIVLLHAGKFWSLRILNFRLPSSNFWNHKKVKNVEIKYEIFHKILNHCVFGSYWSLKILDFRMPWL